MYVHRWDYPLLHVLVLRFFFPGILCVPLSTAHIALDHFSTDIVLFGANITSPTSTLIAGIISPRNSQSKNLGNAVLSLAFTDLVGWIDIWSKWLCHPMIISESSYNGSLGPRPSTEAMLRLSMMTSNNIHVGKPNTNTGEQANYRRLKHIWIENKVLI